MCLGAPCYRRRKALQPPFLSLAGFRWLCSSQLDIPGICRALHSCDRIPGLHRLYEATPSSLTHTALAFFVLFFVLLLRTQRTLRLHHRSSHLITLPLSGHTLRQISQVFICSQASHPPFAFILAPVKKCVDFIAWRWHGAFHQSGPGFAMPLIVYVRILLWTWPYFRILLFFLHLFFATACICMVDTAVPWALFLLFSTKASLDFAGLSDA